MNEYLSDTSLRGILRNGTGISGTQRGLEQICLFGGKDGFLAATNALQAALYEEAVS